MDESHGEKGLAVIKRRGIRLKEMRLSAKEYRIANLLIAYHCRADEVGIAAIQAERTLSVRDKARAKKLYAIAKDMDGLDRVRFNGLDYRMLRTEYGKRLPLVAGCLLEEPLLDALCTSDWDESVAAITSRDGGAR